MTVTLRLMPTKPAPRRCVITAEHAVATTESQFDYSRQFQDWGGGRWTAQLDFAPMSQPTARRWIAWRIGLIGPSGIFTLGDPDYRRPLGIGAQAPLVDGTVAAQATVLPTKAWPASTAGVLLAGAYLSLMTADGPRLHIVKDDADSDSSGEAALKIWPPLRAACADGDAVEIWRPQGMFGLSSNLASWETDANRIMQGFSIMAIEALF